MNSPTKRRELASARPAATAEPVTVETPPPPPDGTLAGEATVDLLAEPEPATRVQTDADAASPLAPVGLELYGSRAAMREPTRFVFRWPIASVNISSPFGVRRNPFRKRSRGGVGWHAGLDLSADTGEQILAAGPGRVLRSGWYYGFGKHVSIEHEGGFVTHYGHMSEILVFAGQRVRRGAPIGLVGSTGHSTGPHLHFTLQHRGKSIDPLTYIGRPNDE